MPFEWQVRHIHLKVIDYLKDNIVYDLTTKWQFDSENTQMLKHYMSAEQVYIEEKLSKKAR